jgi:hypothetical protein
MIPASALIHPKKQRVDFVDSLNSPVPATSPVSAALAVVSSTSVTLHPTLKPIVSHCMEKYITSYTQVIRRKQGLAKFATLDFIPRSARVAFTLQCSAQAREQNEYKALVTECDTYLAGFQKNLASASSSLVTLELKLANSEKARPVLFAAAAIIHGYIVCTDGLLAKKENVYSLVFRTLVQEEFHAVTGVTPEESLASKMASTIPPISQELFASLSDTEATAPFAVHINVLTQMPVH